jgi:UDPglucose 6-dehydrogenase
MNPERIVIGSSHVSAIKVVKELYKSWDASVIETDCKSAELLKYSANSFLAMKISFINMISQLSDQLETNIDDIAYGIGLDQRIGGEFLKAGIGFGGSCFPKDLNAINHVASEVGIRLPLIEDTAAINDEQGMLFFEKMRAYFDGDGLAGKKIALLGLSFKPFTDDTRSSPAIGLATSLLNEKAFLSAYDPLVKDFPIQDVSVLSSLNEALDQTDIAVIVTDWPEFKSLLMAENLKKMKQAVIFDGRNMFTLDEIRKVSIQKPLHYVSIGRPIVSTLHENKWEMVRNQGII